MSYVYKNHRVYCNFCLKSMQVLLVEKSKGCLLYTLVLSFQPTPL